MCGRNLPFGLDPFGRLFLEGESGLYPGLADGECEVRVMFLAEVMEQDASPFQAKRLVDDALPRQFIQKGMEKVVVVQNQASGDFLPSRCVVISVQQAGKPAGGL